MVHQVRVWDLPTRLFHWTLTLCVVALVITGHLGGGIMPWHARLGYVALALLLFRLCWGFVGGRWSRFSSFLYSPGSIIAHLRGQAHPDHLVGHNPLGALSVLVMLFVLLVQVATGLVGDDEIAFTGPLNRFVDSAKGLAATWYHKRVGQWLIVALVLLHVGAVLFYLWKKQDNLIVPMLAGDKAMARPAQPSRDDAASRLAALGLLALCAALVVWLVRLGAWEKAPAPSIQGILRATPWGFCLPGAETLDCKALGCKRISLGNPTDPGRRADEPASPR